MIEIEKTIRIFIGYDPVETVAFHTMVQSLIDTSSNPISITPLNIRNLKNQFYRERDIKQSNEFSFIRFLVPYLCNYSGYAVYFDCDMMLRADVSELLELADPTKAISVVKHLYEPKAQIKYLDTVQYTYPRKNWSSVILWNCSHMKNKILTREYVGSSTGLELHRFTWLEDEEIGELDVCWNWLVGEYEKTTAEVKNVHWTNGGPYFHEYKNVAFADEWAEVFEKTNFCKQRKDSC
jgi:hypothetical protein